MHVATNYAFRTLLTIFALLRTISGQFASTFPSPAPLLEKSPYLSAWLTLRSETTPKFDGYWPEYWTKHILGWANAVRIDGKTYGWTGSDRAAELSNVAISPTRTVLTVIAGPVTFNVTYLSPVEISDWALQSLPFGYMAIDAWSNDAKDHSVQFYTDVTGEWIAADITDRISWETKSTSASIYHTAQRIKKTSLAEKDNIAEDLSFYYAMSTSTPGVSWQTGDSAEVRTGFNMHGGLENDADLNFRSVNDHWPVMAFAVNLGTVRKTSAPIVIAIGVTRSPVVQYRRDGILEDRDALWSTRWKSAPEAIDFFLADYPNALSRAVELDTRIMNDAQDISGDYADILAAVLRQTMASLEFTTTVSDDSESQVRVFMKDSGSSLRATPVDTLYAAFPAYLYLNASLAGKLLEPLLEFQSSDDYGNDFASPDLGGTWPIIRGRSDDVQRPYGVQYCGAMLVMVLAQAQKSGDGSLIHRHYDLLKTWADYLVANTMRVNGLLSADGTTSSSNLLLVGIMGIWSMSRINAILEPYGKPEKETGYYLDISQDHMMQWQERAIKDNHITSVYGGSASTWGLIYNLYAAKLINSDIVPQRVFDNQANFYQSQVSKAPKFGFPFDQSSGDSQVKAHWTMHSAGSVVGSPVAQDMLAQIHKRVFAISNTESPLPAEYGAENGSSNGSPGAASPAMGAAFSLLALDLPDVDVVVPSATLNARNGDHSAAETNRINQKALILGGVFGGLALLAIVGIAIFFFLRRRRRIEETYKTQQWAFLPSTNSTTIVSPYTTAPTDILVSQIPPSKSNRTTRSTQPGEIAIPISPTEGIAVQYIASRSVSPTTTTRTESPFPLFNFPLPPDRPLPPVPHDAYRREATLLTDVLRRTVPRQEDPPSYTH